MSEHMSKSNLKKNQLFLPNNMIKSCQSETSNKKPKIYSVSSFSFVVVLALAAKHLKLHLLQQRFIFCLANISIWIARTLVCLPRLFIVKETPLCKQHNSTYKICFHWAPSKILRIFINDLLLFIPFNCDTFSPIDKF